VKSTRYISPFDAMWREIGCLYRMLEHEREALERAIDGIGATRFHSRTHAKAPTVAQLLMRLGAQEATWIHKRWRADETPRAWQPFVDGSGAPAPEAILGFLREVREATRLKLMKASDADLDRQTIEGDGGVASLRWVLFHLLDQAAFTRGQIAAARHEDLP
jgi:hypothetical protein